MRHPGFSEERRAMIFRGVGVRGGTYRRTSTKIETLLR